MIHDEAFLTKTNSEHLNILNRVNINLRLLPNTTKEIKYARQDFSHNFISNLECTEILLSQGLCYLWTIHWEGYRMEGVKLADF